MSEPLINMYWLNINNSSVVLLFHVNQKTQPMTLTGINVFD